MPGAKGRTVRLISTFKLACSNLIVNEFLKFNSARWNLLLTQNNTLPNVYQDSFWSEFGALRLQAKRGMTYGDGFAAPIFQG